MLTVFAMEKEAAIVRSNRAGRKFQVTMATRADCQVSLVVLDNVFGGSHIHRRKLQTSFDARRLENVGLWKRWLEARGFAVAIKPDFLVLARA